MNTLLVTYQLDNSNETYVLIRDRLKEFPNWAKPFPKVWIIRTSYSAGKVRNLLSSVISEKGAIIVINITDCNWATFKIDDDILAWMKENI